MVNPKIEIINHFDNLINQVDIDIEESLEKYNEIQVIGDLECYKSFKMKEEKSNLIVISESSLNKSFEIENTWLENAKSIEDRCCEKNNCFELKKPDDLEYDKIFKTVDLWSEETQVVDYLNQVRMRTIEELREAQKEALDSYKSQSDDAKSKLYPDKFYFQVRYKKSNPDEWIFKLFTFDTDFYMSPDDINLLEKYINGEDDFESWSFQDLMENLDERMILIGMFQKFLFENLNSEKFPSPVISVRKRDLFAIKQISFHYTLHHFYMTKSSSIDLSNLESLYISETFQQQIEIDGLSSLKSLRLRLYTLDSLLLNNLPSLRNLEINLSHESFNLDQFYNLPSIEYLTINVSPSNTSELSYFSLDSLVNLKGLSLAGLLSNDFKFDLFENICSQLIHLSIEIYMMNNTCLDKLFDDHHFPILKSFSITSKIYYFEKKLFDAFPMLQSLTINNCVGLRVIDFNLFSNLKELISLDLSKNFIDSLDYIDFSGLINLKYLNLSSNKLERIDANLFSNLTNLRVLDLSRNQLKTLNPKLFCVMKNLVWLNLDHNQLVQFDLCILDYIKEIKVISALENPIVNKDEILARFKESTI